ncbi:MAG: response regulator [Gammaproteobacteria bacterium]|nr:response regulator [Gammaproteobacteria bacterium]
MTRQTELTVLLVDDDDVVWEAVARSFRKYELSHKLVCAKDGQEAIDILTDRHTEKQVTGPLVILLDLNMPRMNGFEFLARMRGDERLRQHVVFILTTSSDERDRSRAYSEYVAGYMVKDALGPQFAKLSQLLSHYRSSVELPND